MSVFYLRVDKNIENGNVRMENGEETILVKSVNNSFIILLFTMCTILDSHRISD